MSGAWHLPRSGDEAIDLTDLIVGRNNFGNTVVSVSSAAVSAAIPVAIPTSAATVTSSAENTRREALPPLTRGAHEALLLAARQTAFAELGAEVSFARRRPISRATIVRGERGVATSLRSLQAEHRGVGLD